MFLTTYIDHDVSGNDIKCPDLRGLLTHVLTHSFDAHFCHNSSLFSDHVGVEAPPPATRIDPPCPAVDESSLAATTARFHHIARRRAVHPAGVSTHLTHGTATSPGFLIRKGALLLCLATPSSATRRGRPYLSLEDGKFWK